jgi:hypothetical protein
MNIIISNLHIPLLPKNTGKAFVDCTKLPFLKTFPWYLAGGTALALQVGHRQSVDLDFFTTKNQFDETGLERKFIRTKQWVTSFRQDGTLYGVFKKAKMSFIAYPFFIPSQRFLQCGMVRMLQPPDIAAMKIVAISQRGRKRDFIDLYWYCKNREPLLHVVERAVRCYPGQERNVNHIMRSLTYFDDAEADPMPVLYFKITWPQIKKYFQFEVPHISKKYFKFS